MFKDLLKQLIVSKPEAPLDYLIEKLSNKGSKYIFTTIGMNEEQIDHLVTVEGIRRVDILEMMTLDQVKEIPSHTDTMAMGQVQGDPPHFFAKC